MKINKLEVYNYSSFEGLNTFDFKVDSKEKNIILIGGQNGAGKTSLFSAIKVALYGPLAFGYVGANSHYTQKIKEVINSKAFQKEKVESGVRLSISLRHERDVVEYDIERFWFYVNQRLIEEFTVKKNGEELVKKELDYFQNYLQTLIPPEMFEFFLFDGEEVGNIFSTSGYNSYVKKAIFTMCELDVFELVRKHNANYVAKGEDSGNEEEVRYKELIDIIDSKESELESLNAERSTLTDEISKIEVQIEDFHTAFKNAGGITYEERERLLREQADAEKVKNEMTGEIRNFVENYMPFMIVENMTNDILKQMENEDKIEQYDKVVSTIGTDDIRKILVANEIGDDKVAEAIVNCIYAKFKPSSEKNPNMIYDLSKEQKNKVLGVISIVNQFDNIEILSVLNKRQKAAEITAEVNRILKDSMAEDELTHFVEKENRLLRKLSDYKERLNSTTNSWEEIVSELEELKAEKEKLYSIILDNTQNRNIYELSNKLAKAMQTILSRKSEDIIRKLELYTLNNLQSILRKSNLITRIEIDKDFKFNLYQNQTYSEGDIAALIKNLGTDEFKKTVGKRGLEILFQEYGVSKLADLRKCFDYGFSNETIDLYKKIELSRLSKGERQIFILSLYWAIINLANQEIPFVIDTPYARIDAKHRKEISQKFFPEISEQVIILSTDEEINEEYYNIIKPFVAKEYLLTNNESENRTTVQNKYFYEV